jgi:undecaprenyl-diphosphatase
MVPFDHALEAWVVAHRIGVLDWPMRALSAFGNGGFGWLGIAAVLTLTAKMSGRALAQMALALVCAALLVDSAIKPLVNRPRPWEQRPAITVIGPQPRDPSFPSGHSATAAASAVILTVAVPGAALWWWLLAVAIGYSRVYLGDHFPLDVLAGGAIGAALAWLVVRLTAVADRRPMLYP